MMIIDTLVKLVSLKKMGLVVPMSSQFFLASTDQVISYKLESPVI
jgi:hypothetical protein